MHGYFSLSVHFVEHIVYVSYISASKQLNYFLISSSSTVKMRVENDLIFPVSRGP